MYGFEPGQMIGPYQIINQIGQGGMATVYRAHHDAMGRDVALKVLPREFIGDAEFLARFKREVRLIAKMEHPHILPVYDYGEDNGVPYLVMRYLEAGTLRECLDEGPININAIDKIFSQLCSAVGHAHKHNVIHRDIKPSNVLIDHEGNAFLTDFGIARLVENTTRFTPTGAITGTPAYISPEQTQPRAVVDHRADLYALGVLLFEMLTEHVPFEAESPLVVLHQKNEVPSPAPSSFKGDLPPALDKVVLQSLERDPKARFNSAQDFLLAWKHALKDAGISTSNYSENIITSPNRKIKRFLPFQRVKPHTYLDARGNYRKTRKGLPAWMWIILAVLGLSMITAGGYLALNPSMISATSTPLVVMAEKTVTATLKPTTVPILVSTEVKPEKISTLVAPTDIPVINPPTIIAETQVAPSDSSTNQIFGPVEGSLQLQEKASGPQSRFANVNVKNFIATVTFNTPYSGGESIWDVSLHFRAKDTNDGYRLIIRSNDSYVLLNQSGLDFQQKPKIAEVAVGTFTGLNPSVSATNSILLIALEDKGYLFINNLFKATLNLSDHDERGDIAFSSGFYPGSQLDGKETKYNNFAVWSAEHPLVGPLEVNLFSPNDIPPSSMDRLSRLSPDVIASLPADVNVNDFIVEATFQNPYASSQGIFGLGFAFRSQGETDQYRIIGYSSSNWYLMEQTESEKITQRESGNPDFFTLDAPSSNELLLIAMGKQGLFYVNGKLVERLDLTTREYNSGDIALVAFAPGFPKNASQITKIIKVKNFNIWELP